MSYLQGDSLGLVCICMKYNLNVLPGLFIGPGPGGRICPGFIPGAPYPVGGICP